MRIGKRIFSMVLVMCMLIGIVPVTVAADSRKVSCTAKTSGTGNTVKVKNVLYELDDNGDGDFDINFSTKVAWKSTAKVTSVKDNKGKTYQGYLHDKDSDDCDLTISNITAGRTYTVVISGIKKRGTGSYRKLTLKIKVPSEKTGGKVEVKKVVVDWDNDDYDEYFAEIDIEFNGKVTWRKNAKVTSVKDNKGKTYQGYLTDTDDDECEVYIKDMKGNRTYTIKISGVKARGASSYETVTVKVKVSGDNSALAIKDITYEVDNDDDDNDDDDYDDDDYDDDDNDGNIDATVKFEFNKKITRKGSSYVIIKDTAGKAYSSKSSYVDWDDDECEVHLSGELSRGKSYTYEIVNVKVRGEKSYTTLKGTFTA